jgi:hypothetical protein
MKRIAVLTAVLFAVTSICSTEGSAADKRPKKEKYERSKDGLGSLMKLGSDQAKMVKELNEETRAYKKIKDMIGNGILQKGDTAERIADKYGAPTIVLREKDLSEKWVYKSSDTSFSSNEKIYLIFNTDKYLTGWVQKDPGRQEPH